MYNFYVLENSAGELYFGSTNDLKRRLSEHQENKVLSTRSKTYRLIYYEAYNSEADAREREKQIKYYGQAYSQLKKRIARSRRHES